MKIKSDNGSVAIISMIFIAIALIIIMFIITIFMSSVNSALHGIKTDMYTINKSAILSVNKNKANIDNFDYNKKEYKKYFLEMIKKNYNLNENLKNEEGLIQKIEIKEYEIYKKGTRDNFTDEKCDDVTIHTVLEIKLKPIIMSELLKDKFNFILHEDVNLNMAKTN